MAIANTNIAPLLKEGSNITLTQDGQVITIASSGGGGGGTPGGSDTQIQFNDGGSFGGDSVFTYNKTTNVVGLEAIDFSATPTATDAERRLLYSDDEGTLVYSLKGGNISTPVNGALLALVNNGEATTLAKGEIVYAFSASGQRVQVKRAKNDSDATSAKTFGIVAESITSGAEGFVMVHGIVKNINTIAYAEGTSLYLANTAGAYTSTKPTAPNHLVYIGFVVKSHASAGEIFAKIQNGYELDEIHDVSISSLADKDLLTYESATSLWKNKTTAALSIATGTGTSGQVTYWSGTNTVIGSNTFVFTPTSQFLVNNAVTASGAIARGINFTPSLTAAANNDVLVGLDINPSFTNGAFTNVKNYPIRILNTASRPTVLISSSTGLASSHLIEFNDSSNSRQAYIYKEATSGDFVMAGDDSSVGGNLRLVIRASTALKIIGSNRNVIVGDNTVADGGQRLQVNGTSSFTGTTATDGGQLGSELLSSSGWTSTGWTGDFVTGWTHTVGNTTALTNTLAAVNASVYQIALTVSGRTAGSFSFTFGGVTYSSITATATYYIRAVSTGTLSITPTTDFDGTIIISIKLVSQGTASVVLKDSGGTIRNEIRAYNNQNTFIGLGAGARNLSDFNAAIGVSALISNVNGARNVAIGTSALASAATVFQTIAIGESAGLSFTGTSGSVLGVVIGWQSASATTTGTRITAVGYRTGYQNTTGSSWTALGHGAGSSNLTGSSWIAIGDGAGPNVTGGSNWITIGVGAAQYYSGGTSAATSFSNGVYIGHITKVGAAGAANEIVIGYTAEGLGSNRTVIGNSSTTSTWLGGNLLLGSTTDGGQKLQVTGSSLFTGSITAASAIARGINVTNTLVAAANNDVLVALDINPTFTNGAFTGVTNYAARFQADVIFSDAKNIVFNTTTGTKIGTSTTQKIGFWNVSPVSQPTTAVAAATLVGGGGTTLTDTDTFDGYTLKQIVKALRNTGILA